MAAGIDVPPALVVALEVQAVGRDDPEEALQRRERDRRLPDAREARAFAALHVALVLRRQAIGPRDHRLAESARVLRKLEDRGIALRTGRERRNRAAGQRRRERAAQEIPPPRLDFGDLLLVEEILGGPAETTGHPAKYK